MTTITLTLTDAEIEILQAGIAVQIIFSKPGLNFQEINERALRRSALTIGLQDKVNEALR